ncbi:MAG: IS1634 family transposase, partial [Ferrovum sp.]|nr:IS1634 family transposase [Ferrovum sp.]
LLRTMDTLVECSDALESAMAGLLRPLIDQTLSVVFYDLTTISAEGQTEQNADLREYGLSKNGGVERQVMLGVVQTADGLPIHHEVFAGNTAESTTLIPTLTKILEQLSHRAGGRGGRPWLAVSGQPGVPAKNDGGESSPGIHSGCSCPPLWGIRYPARRTPCPALCGSHSRGRG